jgi:hypothetical protein
MSDGASITTYEKETKKPQPAKPALQGSKAALDTALPVTQSVQRAVAEPARLRPADVLALQRAAGNRAVSGLIQAKAATAAATAATIAAKLTVGPVGDQYEQEADRVADQVLNMPTPTRGQQAAASSQPQAQRQVEEEEVQTKPLAASITPVLQRQVEEEEIQTKPLVQRQVEEEEIQTKPIVQRQVEEEEVQTKPLVQRRKDGGFEAGSEIENRLAAQKGSGAPLSDDVRTFMEPRFGADFSGIRVHTGTEAVQMSQDLQAQAFTHGQDIYLGEGRYDPGTDAGKRLLAHELTHTIQQTGNNTIEREKA